MNNFIHTSILLYRFLLFFIVLWFLAIDAQVTFDMFAEHLVAIVVSSWTFKFQTIHLKKLKSNFFLLQSIITFINQSFFIIDKKTYYC